MPDTRQDTPAEAVARYEAMEPVATLRRHGRDMRFLVANRLTLWRAETALEKEPETIAWVESFAPDEVYVDVGANVGLYAVWAAVVARAQVIAFEPEAQNYATLCRNAALNELSGRLTAYCAALAEQSGFGLLHVGAATAGHSCHAFGEALDFNLKPHAFPYAQGSFAARLDELVAAGVIPQPQHVKIDVDGFEHKVVAGARMALADARCRSVLVEINRALPQHMAVLDHLTSMGFHYSQAEADASLRTEGLFKGCGNYVFRR